MMESPSCKALLISVRLFAIASIFFGLSLIPGDTHAATDIIVQLVSISTDGGNYANGGSHAPAISGDGRYVVFLSEASNLVPDDDNGLQDVFLHDLWTRTTVLVSRSYDGGPANGEPSRPSISATGDFIVYSSDASNVFPGDRNDASDVFLYHRQTDVTELISLNSAGEIGNKNSFTRRPSVTEDGRFVAFFSNSTNFDDRVLDDAETNQVYLRDRFSGTTELISENSSKEIGNGNSEYPTISTDGSVIAFHSFAINLTDEKDEKDDNETSDVFLYDMTSKTIIRISNTPDGWAGNDASDLAALSADGGRIAFVSFADDLLPPGEDNNYTSDIFIYTSANQTIQRVSVSSEGAEGNAISDVPSLSDTGRYIAYYSFADNLVADDTNECTEDTNKKRSCTDVFRHDTQTGETLRVSLSASGEEGNNDSLCSGISSDGQVFVFYSYATNLVDDDINNLHDIFIYSLRPLVRRSFFPMMYKNDH